MLYNDNEFRGYDLLKSLLSQDSEFSKVVKANYYILQRNQELIDLGLVAGIKEKLMNILSMPN